MTPYFCWLSLLLSPKDPTFVGSSIALTQRPPIFYIRLPPGSYVLFKFHQQIDHFCHFRWFFFSNSWKAFTERSKSHSHPMPPNFEPKFGFSLNNPSFFETVFSPNAPAFGSLNLTPVSIWYWSVPPPPGGNFTEKCQKVAPGPFLCAQIIWEPGAFYHPAGANLLFCSCYFKAPPSRL